MGRTQGMEARLKGEVQLVWHWHLKKGTEEVPTQSPFTQSTRPHRAAAKETRRQIIRERERERTTEAAKIGHGNRVVSLQESSWRWEEMVSTEDEEEEEEEEEEERKEKQKQKKKTRRRQQVLAMEKNR